LTSPPTEADVLLTTHGHQDHVHPDFREAFPGQQLNVEEGEINLADVSVKGIKSAHGAYNDIDGSNYIFVVDMAGLRIAHFGDIGQEEFTPEQLDALGEVDVAITQFENSFSQMNLSNKKGFNLMDQLQPKLIIPHHGIGNQEVIEYAIEKWSDAYVGAETATIGRSDLSDQTKFLILQDTIMASAYQKLYDLPEW
jgi:L-ascorbate metabolism protein UlaG (beta-lactamase superfamily)